MIRIFFYILIVSYKAIIGNIEYQNFHFKRIETFNKNCLTVCVLGWGKIQIANVNTLVFLENDTIKLNRGCYRLVTNYSCFMMKSYRK